jgi:hypothetical protein
MKTLDGQTIFRFYSEEDAKLFNEANNHMIRLYNELLEFCETELTESEKSELQKILNENKRNN